MIGARIVKTFLKALWVRFFHLGQRLRFDILPRHFYSEIPDILQLERTCHWRKPYSMKGVRGADLDSQLRFVDTTLTAESLERIREGSIHRDACGENGEDGYGPIESAFLHAFIRKYRPDRIIQIGCGVSTSVCITAARESNYKPSLTCIDPYPTQFLTHAHQKGDIQLIAAKFETLDHESLADLGGGDLLFIDSSHTLGPAGEVSRIILDLMPSLAMGVYVHFHDIWFPYDYPGDLLKKSLFFAHESALLHGFLIHNRRFEILVSMSMLHFGRTSQLAKLIPHYRPRGDVDGLTDVSGDYPSSIFLRVTEEPTHAWAEEITSSIVQ